MKKKRMNQTINPLIQDPEQTNYPITVEHKQSTKCRSKSRSHK